MLEYEPRLSSMARARAVFEAARIELRAVAAGGTIFSVHGGLIRHLAAERIGRLVPHCGTSGAGAERLFGAYLHRQRLRRRRGVHAAACGASGDVPIALPTSGRARIVMRAVKLAGILGDYTVSLLRLDGGELATQMGLPLAVPCNETARKQRAHTTSSAT